LTSSAAAAADSNNAETGSARRCASPNVIIPVYQPGIDTPG
jgi:hypothetical protein